MVEKRALRKYKYLDEVSVFCDSMVIERWTATKSKVTITGIGKGDGTTLEIPTTLNNDGSSILIPLQKIRRVDLVEISEIDESPGRVENYLDMIFTTSDGTKTRVEATPLGKYGELLDLLRPDTTGSEWTSISEQRRMGDLSSTTHLIRTLPQEF